MKLKGILTVGLLTVFLFGSVHLAGAAGGGVPLKQLAGNWAGAGEANFGLCFNSSYSALQDCTSPNTNFVYFTQSFTVQSTLDKNGNACDEFVGANSPWFPSPVTAANTLDTIEVINTTSYNQTTGAGEASFTDYTAGSGTSCNGSVLVNTGNAPATETGTFHFVVSQKGGRIDSSILTETNSSSSLGDVTAHAFAVRQ